MQRAKVERRFALGYAEREGISKSVAQDVSDEGLVTARGSQCVQRDGKTARGSSADATRQREGLQQDGVRVATRYPESIRCEREDKRHARVASDRAKERTATAREEPATERTCLSQARVDRGRKLRTREKDNPCR